MWLQHESVLTPFFFIPDPINVTNYVLKMTNIALIGSLEPFEKNDSDHKTKQKSSTAADWLNQDLHKLQLHRLLWPIRDQPKRKCDWTNLVHAVQNYDKQRKNYGLNHILVNYLLMNKSISYKMERQKLVHFLAWQVCSWPGIRKRFRY